MDWIRKVKPVNGNNGEDDIFSCTLSISGQVSIRICWGINPIATGIILD